MKNEIEWKRVFVRSGFLFDETSTGFSFSNEKRHNVEYLGKVFRHLGLFEQSNVSFVRSIFQPAVLMVDEGKWLTAIEQVHTGTEGGFSDDLEQMDTFMGGIVRWVNEAGMATSYSCDGHNRNIAELAFVSQQDGILFDYMLRVVSRNMWRYRERQLLGVSIITSRHNGFPLSDSRYWLLDVAEALFSKMTVFRGFVEAGHRLASPRGGGARRLVD